MRYPEELIVEYSTFSTLKSQCDDVFYINRRLPSMIFTRPFPKYAVIEYNCIFSEEFPLFLYRISCKAEDRTVNYMSIEPDPVEYYYKYNAFYGLASFDRSSVTTRYLPVMSRDGNVESFQARGGDVGVLWGSSLKWGIFCDRISWEIAVIAVSGDIDARTLGNLRYMDLSSLSEYIASQSVDASVALRFMRQFANNYPIDQN